MLRLRKQSIPEMTNGIHFYHVYIHSQYSCQCLRIVSIQTIILNFDYFVKFE